jgi:SAM-dependent methyltransferase
LSKFPNAKITSYGIENADFYLDLNESNPNDKIKADIVVASQVLEHIWSHASFFKEVSSLAKVGGLIWIACPASNKVHGSPEYFASGFTSSYLRNNLESVNTEILNYGYFGTKRLYLATHWIPGWLSVRAHRIPLLFAFDDKQFLARHALRLRFFFQLIALTFTNPRVSDNERWSTEAWVLARKL